MIKLFHNKPLLIITPNTLAPREKIRWSSRIGKALVKVIQAPVDVLLDSEDEVLYKKDLPVHIVRWAVKEGVYL